MVAWSAIRSVLFNVTSRTARNGVVQRAMSDHRTFPYIPTRFQWTKFKDLMNFYILIGAIPLGLVVTYCNIFIGPATLSEIPDGYEPKHWEYYRHPITRFIAKHILENPQQDYEKFLHHIFEEEEKKRIRALEQKVKQKIRERQDYQAYYYQPVKGKYHRISKETADEVKSLMGD